MHIVFAQFYSHLVTPDYDEIATILRSRGHQAWVGTPNNVGNVEWWCGDERVGVQARPDASQSVFARLLRPIGRRLHDYQFMWRVRRFLHEQQPDIVQVNPASVHGVWLLALAKPNTMHFVIDWRQIGEGRSDGRLGLLQRRWTSLRRKLLTHLFFERACFLHEAGAQRVLGARWRKWSSVVPLGVEQHFLEIEPPDRVLAEDEPVRFLYIGTLSRVRRLERIMQAAARVQEASRNFRVHFIGPNRSEDFYLELIQQLGLQECVSMLPPVPYHTVPSTVLQYDVAFAIVPEEPADWQYHPTLKVLEYRALGIPIVATDVAPNRNVVCSGGNGFLTSNEPASIATVMLNLIQDREQLARISAEARLMRKGLSWEEVVDLYYHDVYARLVNSSLVRYPKETPSL